MRFAIVDSDGLVDNVVVWDGIEPHDVTDDETGITRTIGWAPPDGFTAVELADGSCCGPGDRISLKTGDVIETADVPAPSDNPVSALTQVLVDKGVLTAKEADQLATGP